MSNINIVFNTANDLKKSVFPVISEIKVRTKKKLTF